MCKVEDAEYFKRKLLLETTTFGVRAIFKERAILTRNFAGINLDGYVLKVKKDYYHKKLVKVTPEFESVRKLATANQTSYNNMYNKALAAIWNQFKL